jgi:hypothetical protein
MRRDALRLRTLLLSEHRREEHIPSALATFSRLLLDVPGGFQSIEARDNQSFRATGPNRDHPLPNSGNDTRPAGKGERGINSDISSCQSSISQNLDGNPGEPWPGKWFTHMSH